MKTTTRLALSVLALFVLAGESAEAVTPSSGLRDARYRERAGVSSTDGGVTHQAGVSAGLDERSSFDVGLFADSKKQNGRQGNRQYGDRQNERWFAGARGGVQAGAFADASASQSGNVSGVDITNYAQGQTFVGSEAGVEAGVSNNGVGLGGSAFTGGRASGTIGTEIGPAGVAGTGEAWSGLGAEAGVNVRMREGKLKLGGELGAALGVGGKLGAEITIDTRPIGRAAQGVGQFAKGTADNLQPHAKKLGRNIGRGAQNVGRNVGREAQKVGRTIGGWFRK